jgi:tetratricopeptide (TPR) repeat protein
MMAGQRLFQAVPKARLSVIAILQRSAEDTIAEWTERRIMGIKDDVKRLLQEAELYKKQGLLNEAADKYAAAKKLISDNDRIKNKEKLIEGISQKISLLEKDTQKVQSGSSSPELSSKAQDLIQQLFSFSRDDSEEEAILEGAMALAKFGQFQRALSEFEKLIDKDSHRVIAAKNILRCHIQIASEDKAIDIYEGWAKQSDFPSNQLAKIRTFLEDIIKNQGIDRKLTEVAVEETEPVAAPAEEEEVIDISSVGIYFNEGPAKGKVVELDVNFQSGNLLSIIISKKDAGMIEHLNEGDKLDDLQFFSPIAIFNGSGEVSAKSQIKSGPKQGDYCLDIKITSK